MFVRASFFVPLALVACGLVGCNKDKDKDGEEDNAGENIDEPVDLFAGHDIGAWLSLEATADGKVAAAAHDRTENGVVYGTATIGAEVTWAWEGVDGIAADSGSDSATAGAYTSMAMAADGTPWIVYQDMVNASLKYATRTDKGWVNGIADTGSGGRPDAGYWATITMNPATGNALIAHHDEGEGELRVSRWTGTAWEHDAPIAGDPSTDADGAAVAADVGEYAKVAAGPAGTEYVAYYDRAWGDLKLGVNAGSGWVIETVDSDGDVGQWPEIVISDGTIYIAYHDMTNQDLKLAVGTPGAWAIERVDEADRVGADAAFFVSGGNPDILYMDARENDIERATKGGGSWAKSSVGTDGALGYHNEVVTAGGTSYVGCYDYTNRRVWLAAL